MTLNHTLRRAGILTIAALLALSFASHPLHAQSAGTPPAADAAKKKTDAAKAAAAKQAAEKPAQAGNPQGYRPDPVTNY